MPIASPLHRKPPPRRVRWLALPLLISLGLGVSATSRAEEPPGATVDSVLAIARQLSPTLAARAIETDAARARVTVAGALPDPTLRITSDELDRLSGPRQNKMIYSVEQEIPLWGKRELRRQSAEAEVSQKSAEHAGAETELAERVKIAFALYYQTYNARRFTSAQRPVLDGIARAARERYAQNLAPQQDVIRTEIEATRLANELTRLDGMHQGARGRLNALLLRPIDAPLAAPRALRPLPPRARLDMATLADRARAANPALAANGAMLRGAEHNAQLARREWYPDVTLSVGAIDRTGNGPNGYTASIGVKVPLQWGLHNAQVGAAAADANAARARMDATEQQIRGDLAEATATLDASRRATELMRRQLLPQAQVMLQSSTADYTAGKLDLASVLQAQRDLAAARIELLSSELEEQRQLATIERLIGGDL